MTGVALEPTGPMKLEELIEIYKEQARYLYEAGVDLFVVETMMSLAETRAAVLAIRETCDLPIIASMTFQEDGRTLYGTDPVTAVVVLQSIGADVIGVNCSTGPEQMLTLVRKMKEYAEVPLLVKPNAGLPELVDGETVYPMMGNARMMMSDAAGSLSVVTGADADDPDTQRVLGVHMVAPDASDLIVEAQQLVGNRVPLTQAARLIHPHPTFAEAMGEALLKADGRPLHTR